MSTDVAGRVAALGLLGAGEPVVVAFSGGRDSLCLLDVAVGLAGPGAVLAVHVHHGLRGPDADRDAVSAAATAGRVGAAVRVRRLTVPGTLRASGSSPVGWARDARREALRAAADAWAGPGTRVLVGHTATDQAETVLLRAVSSPGTRSLSGIAPRDDRRGVLRPLLEAGVTRGEAGDWCTARGLRWRDDPTNPGTPRGRVRALLPQLERIDARAVAALGRTAALAREDDDALVVAASALVGPEGDVALRALGAAPVAVGRRVLRRLAEDAVGAPCPRVGARLPDVLALRPEGGGTAALDVGDGVRVLVRAGRLRCAASPPREG
ncbi:ATP-binding protein [Patulibacter sp.]|uniref:tRNA lysidine(34) synthetase n=1 Tax=Patulibacter sp. TaxID=1912859 RepID=UPI00272132F6|nr:ATP-binding protein [Patulibacter sp.]MDO9410714.1 ATP-binding protein [Patulibacter sp.]